MSGEAEPPVSGPRQISLPGVFLRGLLMGAADIVPGVSGGTVAFITGIYARFLAALSGADLHAARDVVAGHWGRVWRRVDGAFLLTLVTGIVISVFSLARVIAHLLETRALLVWAFFFGLILASGVALTRRVPAWSPASALALALALLAAVGVGFAPAFSLPATLPGFFIAGFVAICAMILPGISGSFILLLLGMYPAVLRALDRLDWAALGLFALGAGAGLLVFSRLLHALLARFYAPTLAALTGFLFGSLLLLWPWKLPRPPAGAHAVMPGAYAEAVGDPRLALCLVSMAAGFAAVCWLENRWGGAQR